MRGTITKLKSGHYRIRYDGPRTPEGKRVRLSETIADFRTAQKTLRQRVEAVENGTYVVKTGQTVTTFLDHWFDSYAKAKTTLRTQQGYRANIDRYIIPAIGTVPLQKLTRDQVAAIYGKMKDKGLSSRTCLHVYRVLSEALRWGVECGAVARNVASSKDCPKPESDTVSMWNRPTIHQFQKLCESSRYRDVFLFDLLTGMRRSEYVALTWDNVDLTNGKVAVVQTLQRIKGKGLVWGEPKTKNSRRSIALSQDAIDLLRTIRGQQILDGVNDTTNGLVFCQVDGSPLNPDDITNEFHQIIVKNGLPHLTLHGLRHAHATLLLSAGVHVKTVSERLGHANSSITLDTYSHVLPDVQQAAADAIDKQLQP